MARWHAAMAVLCGATAIVYLPVISSLVRQWASDENYSHGFLVAPIALLFAWKSRHALAATKPAPHAGGLVLVVFSLLLFIAGQLAAELFLTRVSLLGVAAGSIVFLRGPAHLRRLLFPFLLLLLVIPLPALVFNQIAFPLQLLASKTAESVLTAANVPVLREGNVLVLPNLSLEVAEACSGLRSLASLVALALILGKWTTPRPGGRIALALLSIPVAVIANAARVAGTGLATAWIGPAAAEGFFHEFSGWLMFVGAFAVLLGCARLIARAPRWTSARAARPALELS
jgi:exosortase